MKKKEKNLLYEKNNIAGFSLIELMVSMVILVIIVLTLSKVFHQSTIAWDGGTRKAQCGMTARSILGVMSREMAAAVAADFSHLDEGNITDNGNRITFITLAREEVSGKHTARKITYRQDGSDLKREEWLLPGNGYTAGWSMGAADKTAIFATNVEDFIITTSDKGSHNYDLPEFVEIELWLYRTADVSGVGGESAGPDGSFGNKDDIKS